MNTLLNSIVVVATLLGSWMAFPQARRLLRTRRVEGLSGVWIGVSVAINAWWLAYGIAADVWALIPVSAISLVLYASMAVLYVMTLGRVAMRALAAGALGLGLVPLPFLLIGGWQLAAIAIGLAYGVQLLPAVVAACRTRDLAGVAASTWLIAWAEAALWLVYGLGVRDLALTLAGLVGVAMSSVIVARLALTGHDPFEVVDPRRRLAVSRSI